MRQQSTFPDRIMGVSAFTTLNLSLSQFASRQFYHLPFIICHHLNSLEQTPQQPTIYFFRSKPSTHDLPFLPFYAPRTVPLFLTPISPCRGLTQTIFKKSRTFLRKLCLSIKRFSIESSKPIIEKKGRGRKLR